MSEGRVCQPVIVDPKLPGNPTPLFHCRKEVVLEWGLLWKWVWSVVVTFTASLVPKVQEEKGVPSVCCMGGCAHAFSQILEICATNIEFQKMGYNIVAHTLCCVGVVGFMLVTMSVYVPKTLQLFPQCRTCWYNILMGWYLSMPFTGGEWSS